MMKKILMLLFIIIAIPLLCFSQPVGKKIQKMSFDFVDADVRNVLRGLADVMGKNIIIGDDVKELKDKTITLKLDNISMEEALDVIIKSKDLAKFEEGNVIRVITLKKFYDEKKREGDDKAAFVKEKLEKLKQGEEFVTETIFLNYSTAKNVVKVIRGDATVSATTASTPGAPPAVPIQKGLLSEYGMVTEVEWTNAIIVKDTRESVAIIKKIINEHDYPPEQVQIHARIVVADTDFSRDLGIKWNLAMSGSSNFLNRDMTLTPGVAALPAASAGGFAFLVGNAAASLFIDGVIQAAETEGLAKTIASPKVVAISSDTKKAIIKKGDNIPYQTVAQTGATPTTQWLDAVLSLEVTPQVTKDGRIKMKIIATKDEPYTYTIPGGLSQIAKKQKYAETNVIIKDGETVVIGGIYETTNEESETGIPLLMKIPVLGWLFKNKHIKDKKTELLIFVTPTIIKNIYKDEG